jgi:hypothetical protein
MPMAAMAAPSVAMEAARQVEQEQLGDLKLYRVPDRTTVASRQSKQVRLLDRSAIPVTQVYGADVPADQTTLATAAIKMLRTMNSTADHLGLPLPSGSIAVFATHGGDRLLERESSMRDLAVDEEVEINLGASPDVWVSVVRDRVDRDSASEHVDISNAHPAQIRFELRLQLREGTRVVRADHSMGTKNGRPIFRLTIPAHASATVRYQTRRASNST